MKKQSGFTLIELVVVIIILGILAVVAAPKFINLQGDARVSTLKGMQAAIQSANTLIYSKASLQGKEDDPIAKVYLSSDSAGTPAEPSVATAFGNMNATQVALQAGLDIKFAATQADAKTDGDSWVITTSGNTATITQVGAPTTCTLTYTQAAKNKAPEFTIAKSSDC